MAGIDRTTLITGPALITYGGQKFWSKGDVALNFVPKLFSVGTAHFGEVDQRVTDRMFEVSFEPSGRFTAALAAVMWPYAATLIGASIFGSSDAALVIHGRDGKKITLHNAAVTQMPNLRSSVAQTLQGPIKFTGILKKNTDPSNSAAYYSLADQAYPGDADFDVADILTKAYASAWGDAAPWDAFYTEAGWEISFGMQTKPQMVDGLGTVDITLQGLTVSAKSIPVGPTPADILAKQAPAEGLGNSISSAAEDLVISATGVYAAVYNAGIISSGFVYGSDKKRVGATEWRAMRTITAGSADPLFYIGESAPS
jgi:hypothetical protein